MRRSGWALCVVALVAWLACILFPAIASIGPMVAMPRSAVEIRSAWSLLTTSVLWAFAVAVISIVVGWAPGRLLGRSLWRKGFAPLGSLMLLPICLPAYVVFYAWWQSWPAETAFYQWVVANHHMRLARQFTLFLGLVCWSWPLVSWCVAGEVAATPAQREELLLIDGARWWRRLLDHFHCDRRGLAIGGLLVFLSTLANTTCFDLSEVFTFSNELRAISALNANARDIFVAGAPMMIISVAGALAVWALLARPSAGMADRARPAARSTKTVFALILLASVALPMALFGRHIAAEGAVGNMIREFIALYRWSVADTLGTAAISGLVGAVIAIGFYAAWQDHRPIVRAVADVAAFGWLSAAILPGTLIGVGLQAAYNRGSLTKYVFSQSLMLNIAHLTCFGFVAVLMARWMARGEPQQLSDMRRLDGADTLPGLIQTNWPRLLSTAAATVAIIFVLSVGETPVTAVVAPPHRAGSGPLALTLLNDMHYQRPQTVMIASFGMLALAALATVAVILAWRLVRSYEGASLKHRIARPIAAAALLCGLLLLGGCEPDDPDFARPIVPQVVFGSAGMSPGQFAYPRAIDADATRGFVYVIDKEARVQRFGLDGRLQVQWKMPEKENGKPTGVSVAPDGRVFVADTHYFRVIAYDPDGNELMRFGEMGRGPGQFIYVTDIAFGPEGRLYVSEYGGNDRIQVFDSAGRYLFEFGSFGREIGQYTRPQSLLFNRDKTELFIADACNHRIVVTDPQGKVLRTFGSAGRSAGQLTFPYGLTLLSDGSILVAEFGNNRLQRFDPSGQSLGIYGTVGRNPGQLQYPWGVAATSDRIFVLDSGNNRVQVMRTP